MEKAKGADLHRNGTTKPDGMHNGHSQAIPGLTSATKDISRALSDEEFDRYSRQMIVPGMGKDGMVALEGLLKSLCVLFNTQYKIA